MIPWLAAGLLSLGVHFGRLVTHDFEKAAALDIASLLDGPDKKVTVKTTPEGLLGPLFFDLKRGSITAEHFSTAGLPLFTDPERSKAGRIGELQINLRDFSLKGLHVESLTASIPECRFDAGLAIRERKVRLSRSGVGTGTVVVSENDLEPFILRKVFEIKRVKVKLDRGKAWVEGYGEFLIAKTEFLVVADLGIEDGTKINLVNAKVIFGWQKADEFAKKALLDAMNPVVDLKKDLDLLDTFYLENIDIHAGRLSATGRTKIPNRPTR